MIGWQRRYLHGCKRMRQFRPEYRSGLPAPAERIWLCPDSGKPENLLMFLRYGLYTHSAVQYGD
jgi:hypothetical protein